jgi:hypothetical protein
MITMRRILLASKHLCGYDRASYLRPTPYFNMIMFNMLTHVASMAL